MCELHYSEAEKVEQINKASGEANAMLAVAEARARGLRIVGSALADRVNHHTQTLLLNTFII